MPELRKTLKLICLQICDTGFDAQKNLPSPWEHKCGKYTQEAKFNILMRFPVPIWAMCPMVFSSSFIMDCSKAKAATREKNSLTFSPRIQDSNNTFLQLHSSAWSNMNKHILNTPPLNTGKDQAFPTVSLWSLQTECLIFFHFRILYPLPYFFFFSLATRRIQFVA